MDEDVSFSTSFPAVDAETVMMNMRHQDETQFYTLVKMHLSFLLHFTIDNVDAPVHSEVRNYENSKKILPFSMKTKSKSSRNGGVVVLSHEGVCQAYQLIEFLSREESLTHEGLFRKTGNIARQQELKQELLSGSSIDFESGMYSAHDCASVLKGFLASLNEPLLTKALYHAHCQAAAMCPLDAPADQKHAAHNKQVKALQLLFLLIPAENYQLLKDLLLLLHKVSLRHPENKMNALNLGTMLAPHILCPRKMSAAELQTSSGPMAQAVAFMVENAPQLFKVPYELEVDMRAFLVHREGTPGSYQQGQHTSDTGGNSPQVSTVFTFVDRQQSAAAGEQDDTETALAGLYAHISSMPDSVHRQKLIKQFNHESGAGTPNLARRTRTRSFGEALRKHLFFTGKVQKGGSVLCRSSLSHHSASAEALASPTSPELRWHFCEEPDNRSSVSMWPTPSQGRGKDPVLKQTLLTPTAVAGRFTPRLAYSLCQVQQEGIPSAAIQTLPGSARRPDHTNEMLTFRTGRNSSVRRGQVPLRPVKVDAIKPPPAPNSPISQKMDTACSATRVQMLTPRNRRAVCLLSQTSLAEQTRARDGSGGASRDAGPGAAKRPRGAEPEEALSSPFQQYLLQRDMLTAEPVDLSPAGDTPPLPAASSGAKAGAAPVVPSPARLLAGEAALSDSLLVCLDGGRPAAISVASISASTSTSDADASGEVYSESVQTTAGRSDAGGHSLLTPAVDKGRPQRTTLADLSNRRPELDTAEHTDHGALAGPEDWLDAGDVLPAEQPGDHGENQRRKTLTDRETNPMAHRKIGAARKRRSVMFETDL